MDRLINADDILSRAHDVVLQNGAKHRCFDATLLHEIPTVDAMPIAWLREYQSRYDNTYGMYGGPIMCDKGSLISMAIDVIINDYVAEREEEEMDG